MVLILSVCLQKIYNFAKLGAYDGPKEINLFQIVDFSLEMSKNAINTN